MKIIVAIDSLKGSLTSMEAGQAIAEGISRVDRDVQVSVFPLADGGEGTVEALVSGMSGEMEYVTVTGPLGEPVVCPYGILRESKTAILEMAGAAGIILVPDEKRNPLYTTTYGVGEVIRDAIGKGCRRFIVGIGGSATNDGGIGMLQALQKRFLKRRILFIREPVRLAEWAVPLLKCFVKNASRLSLLVFRIHLDAADTATRMC